MNTTENYIIESHVKNLNTKWDSFSQEVKDIQNSDTFSILYATDIHYIRKYALYVPTYYRLKDMVEFSKFAGFDLLALTGDIVDGNTTLKRQKRDLNDVLNLVCEAKTTSVLISKGNHDDCSWYAYKNELGEEDVISKEEWYSYVVNPLRVQYPVTVDENNKAGGYYYIDYPYHKIRVINLNTNDTPMITDENGKIIKDYCGQWNLGISEKQLKWLSKALAFKEEGWSVIFMSHNFVLNTEEHETMRNGDLAWEIIKAFKKSQKGSVKSDEKYFEADVSYDFSDNLSNDVLVYMYGHIHKDTCNVYDGITAVGNMNMLGNHQNTNQNWDNPSVPLEGGWDCVMIDKKRRTLKTKRYGVEGADRQINL